MAGFGDIMHETCFTPRCADIIADRTCTNDRCIGELAGAIGGCFDNDLGKGCIGRR
jgi:hypothetical protein